MNLESSSMHGMWKKKSCWGDFFTLPSLRVFHASLSTVLHYKDSAVTHNTTLGPNLIRIVNLI